MPTRLPTAWFMLAALSLAIPVLLMSLLNGLWGLLAASILPAISGAAACLGMGFAYRFLTAATGAHEIRVAGWVHWTLWLIALIAQAGFWVLQARILSNTPGGASSYTSLGIASGIGALLHLLGWVAFIAAVASARRNGPAPGARTFE